MAGCFDLWKKKSQTGIGIVQFTLLFLIGLLVYAVLSENISTQAENALNTVNGLSGTEQFFISNIHLFVIVGFLIVTLAVGGVFWLTSKTS